MKPTLSPANVRMTNPFKTLPIPRILWDSFEATLTAQVNRLVKDIAETLDRPAKPLLDAIKKDKVAAYLWEEPAHELLELSEMRCQAHTRHPENPAIVCNCDQPIVWSSQSHGARRCAEHLHIKEIHVSSSLISLKPILIGDDTYYLREGSGRQEIVNVRMELVGVYQNSVATLFVKEK